ncbi:Sterigmatocystin biosynthesis regulatory protein [Podospora aff. communis PSN243]|uniref:Sterigmatocystin biosynthesis regulatory protein n=1 Tax=Podospora aff. communis PSN243 TaxID=3040156 RepID=A0AAV9G3W0_9PEZI|nr:Sterigmatocystin biosynthesis regulatory protein [Podospora aff. communis PSN243]
MVGVPGRSKACLTCRKRRKGCDLKRPTCMQCSKAGLKCGGYDPPRVFVVSTPESRYPGYSLKATASPQTPSALWDRIQQNQLSSEETHLRLLSRPEEERRCINLFWEAYFPSGRPIRKSEVRSYTCSWTETAQKLYRDEQCLRHALWANSLLLLGCRHGTDWMGKEAFIWYGKALAVLRVSLSRSKGVEDASVATIKLLGMFETFSRQQKLKEPSDDTESPNWQQHIAGELALFMTRTPLAYVEGDAHYVFADERAEMALSSILRRKRLALSAPEWKSVPWQRIHKDMKDILIDILVEIPGLVEDLDFMRREESADAREVLRADLERRCWEHHRDLRCWLDLLGRLAKPAGTCPLPCPKPNPKPAGTVDIVTRVARVHGMSFFWVTSLVLYSVLREVCEQQNVEKEGTDPLHHAHRLAEAISILMRPEAGLYGRHSVALQIEIAMRYAAEISSPSEETEALLARLQSLRDD